MAVTDQLRMALPLGGAALLTALLLSGGCKLSEVRPDEQVPEGYLPAAEVRAYVQGRLRAAGVEPTSNVGYQKDDVEFTAEGFDYNLRVGWYYDYPRPVDPEHPPELTPSERKALKAIRKQYEVYFLLVTAQDRDALVQQVDGFLNLLYMKRIIFEKTEFKKGVKGFNPDEDNQFDWEKAEGRKISSDKMKGVGQTETAEDVLENIERDEAKRREREKLMEKEIKALQE